MKKLWFWLDKQVRTWPHLIQIQIYRCLKVWDVRIKISAQSAKFERNETLEVACALWSFSGTCQFSATPQNKLPVLTGSAAIKPEVEVPNMFIRKSTIAFLLSIFTAISVNFWLSTGFSPIKVEVDTLLNGCDLRFQSQSTGGTISHNGDGTGGSPPKLLRLENNIKN